MSADVHQLRSDLADRFDTYPPVTWTPQMMRAMITILDAYGVVREAELDLTENRTLRIVR